MRAVVGVEVGLRDPVTVGLLVSKPRGVAVANPHTLGVALLEPPPPPPPTPTVDVRVAVVEAVAGLEGEEL